MKKVERTILYNAEQEGLRRGVKKGMEKGRLDVAKNMLDDGMDISSISKYTGISELELKNISK